jgi:hypothetical protein
VRTIAIDWSGDATGGHRRIWLAEVRDGQLIRLENGRDAKAVARHLCDGMTAHEKIVVGLDFAFGFPAWFSRSHGAKTVHDLWELAARDGEEWLSRCEPPFWGRGKTKRPVLPDESMHFRRTEREIEAVKGIRPKSVFQIGGAGSVGTGSIRGMRLLGSLKACGFSVWPFDDGWPRIVEIYPRVLTREVRKSNKDDRRDFLERDYPTLAPGLFEKAVSSEDAFDAAVSALVMWSNVGELERLEASRDEEILLEGWIWSPPAEWISTSRSDRPRREGAPVGKEQLPADVVRLARELLLLVGPDELRRRMSELIEKYRRSS